MLKSTLVATIAILGLSTAAWAGEGSGDPFPGPNAAVTHHVQLPKYKMNNDAPFNSFWTDKPTPLVNYKAAKGGSDNPYPFKMSGQLIRTQPAPRTSLANGAAAANHG